MKKSLLILLSFFVLAIPTVDAKEKKVKTVKVKIYTTMGEMKVELYNETPQHRDNFIKLVNEGFYEETLFHRVIEEFMIQGGDPYSKLNDPELRLGSGDLGYNLDAEIALPTCYHKRGALAAARQGDEQNPEHVSNASQFYLVYGKQYTNSELDAVELNVQKKLSSKENFRFTDEQRLTYKTMGGTPFLDTQYTVFGQLIEGFDVLQKISEVATGEGDRPKVDIKILRMRIVKK